MKLLFSENLPIYEEYLFPYSVYGLAEPDDSYDKIYGAGFIHTRIEKGVYYLARSTRINLAEFELSSENRRIKRKVEELEVDVADLSTFKYDFSIGKFAKDFYDTKFGKGTMSAQKMKWIFTSRAFTHVLVYRYQSEVIGYCPIIKSDKILHYAYPFYSLDVDNPNLGMGMMLLAIEWAKENGLDYIYLGTAYSDTSLYKSQFNGFEYFTGWKWSNDLDMLKEIIREGQPTNMFADSDIKMELLQESEINISLKAD